MIVVFLAAAALDPFPDWRWRCGEPRVSAHLDGLDLSRAWTLEDIAAGMPPDHKRRPRVLEGYGSIVRQGGHQLGWFAVYLVTGRGVVAAR